MSGPKKTVEIPKISLDIIQRPYTLNMFSDFGNISCPLNKGNGKGMEKQSQTGARDLILVRRTHTAGMEIARWTAAVKMCLTHVACSLRPPSREFPEVIGPGLVNLSAGSQTIATQHEANDHV